ncbi:MAG: methyltransferase [Novosphingobium sp.]|nr:methyltransferase [Novosphingobium sp.]
MSPVVSRESAFDRLPPAGLRRWVDGRDVIGGADESALRDVDLLRRFCAIRQQSDRLVEGLSPEDCQVQSMADVSPLKWHLAHTSWFFETFVLMPHLPGYRVFARNYAVLFNSYYVGVGERHPRPERGLLSRPSLATITAYRSHVDAAMGALLAEPAAELRPLVELGLQHEQQHQELMLMDIQHILSRNPLEPVYREDAPDVTVQRGPGGWIAHPGGLHHIGSDGGDFAFDNEGPRQRLWLEPFELATGLVTAGTFAAFIADGGYRRPELWLHDGWQAVEAENWQAPLYWHRDHDGWSRFSLRGRRPIDPGEPVVHLSYYEADALARWVGARLPTEAEWEVGSATGQLAQGIDTAWQWTSSAYAPYPGYRPATGAIGEYNGKFMVNQMVLRGGSLATPIGQARPTYRNFFPPAARWMFAGVRLARDA